MVKSRFFWKCKRTLWFLTLNDFESRIFLLKTSQIKRIKILRPKQKLQRLPIVFAQEISGNTSENLMNDICQIICYLYRAKKNIKDILQNVYYLWILETIKNLALDLSDKTSLKRSDEYLAL